MFSFLYCNRKRAGWKKIHNGSQWLVSPFPCAISLCIDFADLGLQSDRCFLHDSCSSSMSSRVRDILKFTSKICLQHLFNLFENVRTNETWDLCSQPVCVQVVADHDLSGIVAHHQMKCRRVVGLVAIFPPFSTWWFGQPPEHWRNVEFRPPPATVLPGDGAKPTGTRWEGLLVKTTNYET